jgi:hypothetical protein
LAQQPSWTEDISSFSNDVEDAGDPPHARKVRALAVYELI